MTWDQGQASEAAEEIAAGRDTQRFATSTIDVEGVTYHAVTDGHALVAAVAEDPQARFAPTIRDPEIARLIGECLKVTSVEAGEVSEHALYSWTRSHGWGQAFGVKLDRAVLRRALAVAMFPASILIGARESRETLYLRSNSTVAIVMGLRADTVLPPLVFPEGIPEPRT